MLKIGEMNELAILFDGFNKDVQSVWGIAVEEQECTSPKLRGIVLTLNPQLHSRSATYKRGMDF